MQMSDGEILTSYRQAKDKSKQVQILADLNDCTIADIIRILIARGISPKAFRIRKRVSGDTNTTSKVEKPDPVKEKKLYMLLAILEKTFGRIDTPAEVMLKRVTEKELDFYLDKLAYERV
jgi:hypothetical protein